MDWKEKYINKLDDKVSKKISEFFVFLLKNTNISQNTMKELMSGANIQIDDGGRFYTLMCHDILKCEQKQYCKSCLTQEYYASSKFGAGSSHKSYRDDDYPQYRMGIGNLIDFETNKTSNIFDFLIGLRKVNEKIYTWFQFEFARGSKNMDKTSKIKSIWNMSTPYHILSTIKYGITRRNQGPFGESDRIDSNPISLKLKPLQIKNKHFRPVKEQDSVNYKAIHYRFLKF